MSKSDYQEHQQQHQHQDQDMLMPGFRFHPTEEELIDFYLRRKVEGKKFNMEIIAFVDLYRYDPWELPAMAMVGEKEWFFYVPRDRKYRNGDRPNRVTRSGYWKATGTDKMIRNERMLVIGLKKTLVFYKGKAPKGIRTIWTMNEYRLPQQELPDNQTQKKSEISLCRLYKRAGGEDNHHIVTPPAMSPSSSSTISPKAPDLQSRESTTSIPANSKLLQSKCHSLADNYAVEFTPTADSSNISHGIKNTTCLPALLHESINLPPQQSVQEIHASPTSIYNPLSSSEIFEATPSSLMTVPAARSVQVEESALFSPAMSAFQQIPLSSDHQNFGSQDDFRRLVDYQQQQLHYHAVNVMYSSPHHVQAAPVWPNPLTNSMSNLSQRLWEWNSTNNSAHNQERGN